MRCYKKNLFYIHALIINKYAKACYTEVMWILILWPIAASILSFIFQANMLFSTLLFFGVPSIYLSIRNHRSVKKALLFSAALGLTLSIVTDYVMTKTGSWNFPNSVFPRLFGGYVTVEQTIWILFFLYFVVIFYETFLEKDSNREVASPNLKYLFLITSAIFSVFIFFYLWRPEFLSIDYFYLKSGIVLTVIPLALVLLKFPRLYKKFAIAAAYFFFFSFIYELTGLSLGHWEFTGARQYLGMMEILGLRFPLEEFFFWISSGAMGILAYYEFFDDDKK